MQYIATCATRILQSLQCVRAQYCNIYVLARERLPYIDHIRFPKPAMKYSGKNKLYDGISDRVFSAKKGEHGFHWNTDGSVSIGGKKSSSSRRKTSKKSHRKSSKKQRKSKRARNS